MIRLFVRLWLSVVVLAMAAAVLLEFLMLYASMADDSRMVTDSVRGGYTVLEQTYRTTAQPERMAFLAEMTETFGFPVVEIDDADLPTAQRPTGRVMWSYFGDMDEIVTYIPVRGGGWLAAGPLPDWNPMSIGERALFASVAFAFFGLVLYLILWPLARELRQMERVALDLADGEGRARIDVPRASALAPLADAFNTMADRSQEQLEARRRLLHAVSHEMRTPLTRIELAVAVLSGSDHTSWPEQLEEIEGDVDAMNQMVQELLDDARFAAGGIADLALVAVADALHATVAARRLPGALPVEVEIDPVVPARWALEQGLFVRAVGNLVGNALRHAGAEVHVRAWVDDTGLVVDVDDDGPGIAEADRARVLRPFTRLDDDGRGFGLGLSIVARIVQRHGGSIEIGDADLGGCRVRTRWPRPMTSS